MPDTITIIDDRTGKKVTVPITNGTFAVVRAAGARSRPAPVRPGLHVDGGLRQSASPTSTVTPASCATAATPSSSWPSSSTYLEVAYLLLNGELPEQGRSSTSGPTTSPTTPSSTTTCASASWRASTTTPTRWACSCRASPRCRPTTPRPRTSSTSRTATSRSCGSSPRRRRWPPTATASASGMPTVYPDNSLSYAGNFLNMMWKVGRVRGRPGRSSVPSTCSSSSTPTTSRTAAPRPCASSAPARPTRTRARRGGRRRALRPAARRRQRAGRAHAHRDRLDRQRAGVHRGGEGGQGPPDGLRPPRLQELRPAGHHHQADRRRGVRGHRARTRCSTSP